MIFRWRVQTHFKWTLHFDYFPCLYISTQFTQVRFLSLIDTSSGLNWLRRDLAPIKIKQSVAENTFVLQQSWQNRPKDWNTNMNPDGEPSFLWEVLCYSLDVSAFACSREASSKQASKPVFLQVESDPCRARSGRQNKTQERSDCLDSSVSGDSFIYAGAREGFGISMIHPDELTDHDHAGTSKQRGCFLCHAKSSSENVWNTQKTVIRCEITADQSVHAVTCMKRIAMV